MRFDIKYRPSYSMLVVDLEPGEKITAEAGAMTYMSPNIVVATRSRGGLWGSLKLSVLGRQSFFINDYEAVDGKGEIGLVSAPLGDIETLQLEAGRGYIIQKAAYIASTQGVNLDIEWQGFTKGIFGQGLFMIKTYGRGNLFINTFGAIDKHILKPEDELIVDNFHLVAFSDTCEYEVRKFGSIKSTILGGEGLVTRIKGPGEILIQTKNLREFAEWLWTMIEPRVQSRGR
jgi:uncharacterized protein (TIGR00266 family)